MAHAVMKVYIYFFSLETNLIYPYFLGIVFFSSGNGKEHTVPEIERVFSGCLFKRCYLNTTRQIFKPICKLMSSFKYREKNQLIQHLNFHCWLQKITYVLSYFRKR